MPSLTPSRVDAEAVEDEVLNGGAEPEGHVVAGAGAGRQSASDPGATATAGWIKSWLLMFHYIRMQQAWPPCCLCFASQLDRIKLAGASRPQEKVSDFRRMCYERPLARSPKLVFSRTRYSRWRHSTLLHFACRSIERASER